MKEIVFYALVAVLTALECSLILVGILPPMSSYSTSQLVLNIASIAAVIYMGWTFTKTGMKKVAMKGAIAGGIIVTITLLSAIIGISAGIPVLGMAIQHEMLPLAFLSIAVSNVLLFTIFAVLGAFLARKLQKNAKK
ncbi:MAG: hypothetical protein V1887_00160 [Candidatus Aenigmatarchaeota archaeon]